MSGMQKQVSNSKGRGSKNDKGGRNGSKLLAGISGDRSDEEIKMPTSAAIELKIQTKDLETKQEVTDMMKPLVSGFLENSIYTNKLQDDVDKIEMRLKSLEVVFNGGQGQNFIYDACLSKFAEEVSLQTSLSVFVFIYSDSLYCH